ncbi:MAG: WD40 repeat domain-containing protein [Candidatus Lustribacter sp.]
MDESNKNVLSPDQVDRLQKLLDSHTAAWTERYGGQVDRIRRLLADSLDAIRVEQQRQAAAAQRERELEEENRRRELQNAEERTAAANRLARRTRVFAAAMLAVAVAALVLGAVAWREKTVAAGALEARVNAEHAQAAMQKEMYDSEHAELLREQQAVKIQRRLTAEANAARRNALAATKNAQAATKVAQQRLTRVEAYHLEVAAGEFSSDINTDTGMLLGVEAFNENPGWEAGSALLSLVQQTPRLLRAFRGMQAPALSGSGSLMAVAADAPPVYRTQLWDQQRQAFVQTWNVTAVPSAHESVQDECFADHDRDLVTLTVGGTLRVYDVASRRLLKTIPGALPLREKTLKYDRDLSCAPDSSRVLIAREGTLGVFDVRTLAMDWRHENGPANVVDATMTPSGSMIAVSGADGSVSTWDARGNPIATCAKVDLDTDDTPPDGDPQKLALSPDGKLLAAYSPTDQKVKVYRLPACTATTQEPLPAPDAVGDLRFADNGDLLDVDQNSRVLHWDPQSGKLKSTSDEIVSGWMTASLFEPASIDRAGRLYATAYYGNGVFLYNLAGAVSPLILYAPPSDNWAGRAAFTPDGYIVQPVLDGFVHVWRADGTALPGLSTPARTEAGGVLMAPRTGKAYIYDAQPDHPKSLQLIAYDFAGGRLTNPRPFAIGRVKDVINNEEIALSRDESELVVFESDGLIQYSIATGKTTVTPMSAFGLPNHPGNDVTTYLNPFGSYAIVERTTQFNAATFDVYDRSGRFLWHVAYPPRAVKGVEVTGFGVDGATMLVRDENYIDALDLATGRKHPGRVHLSQTRNETYAVLSPKNDLIAVETTNPVGIQLYDATSGLKVGSVFSGPAGYIKQIVFSPDENSVAVFDRDRQFFLWDINPKDIEQQACQDANRELTREEWDSLDIPFPYNNVCAQYGIH